MAVKRALYPERDARQAMGECAQSTGATSALVVGNETLEHYMARSEACDRIIGDRPGETHNACMERSEPAEIVAARKASEAKRIDDENRRVKAESERSIAAEKAAEKKAAAARAEWNKRSAFVSIGMTKHQVLATKWGKPERVNSTVSRHGEREQWVYGGGQYLYFENGVLTSIQQSK